MLAVVISILLNVGEAYNPIVSPLYQIVKMADDFIGLGRTISCLADLLDEPTIREKGYKATSAALDYIDYAVAQGADNLETARLVTGRTLVDLQRIDQRCVQVPYPSMTLGTLQDAVEFAQLGSALERSGNTLKCLLANEDLQIISQIRAICSQNVEGIARDSQEPKSPVAILLPHDIRFAENLRKLSKYCQ